MAKKLELLYPGKTDVDANNQFGTFKNRTSDALKDGTPYEKGWASDLWGWGAHILKKAGIIPNGAEENETNSQYYDALESLVGRRGVEFETSSDLVINFQSSTTVDMDMKRLKLLDSNFVPKYLNNVNVTYNMPADLEAGTSEKSSVDYGLWIDSDEVLRLVPDLVGVADSTVAGFLADSTATLLTDLVHAGDRVYNLTTLVQTTVSADAVVNGQVALTDDIISSGDSYKIVKLSPEGLGETRGRIGAVSNNSSGDFDDTTYAQIQERKQYNGNGTDFGITGQAGFSLTLGLAKVYQINDWTGSGFWYSIFSVDYGQTANTNASITISGIIFTGGTAGTARATGTTFAVISSNLTDVITITYGGAQVTSRIWIDAALKRKPSWVK